MSFNDELHSRGCAVWEAIRSIVQPGDWLEVLIVSDDRISLKILASVAKRLGPLIRAKWFESSVEALAWVKDHAPIHAPFRNLFSSWNCRAASSARCSSMLEQMGAARIWIAID
jgi:hypothetical protein